jgi:hypothetical protein
MGSRTNSVSHFGYVQDHTQFRRQSSTRSCHSILMSVLLLLLLPLSALIQPAEAQIPIGWNAGLSEPDNSPFEFDSEGNLKFEYWINNDYLVAIEVSLEYDLPFNANSNGDETMTIEAGSNDSVILAVMIQDPLTWSGGVVDQFDIEVTLTSLGNVPQSSTDQRSIDGEIRMPNLYDLVVEVIEPAGSMNSGTSIEISLTVTNNGNAEDTISEVEIDDNCPLLSIEGADSLKGKKLAYHGGTLSHILVVEASTSHPDRKCTIDVSVRSNGDQDWARDGVEVMVEVGSRAPDDPPSDDDKDDVGIIVQSNLPAPSALLTTLSLLSAVLLRKRRIGYQNEA